MPELKPPETTDEIMREVRRIKEELGAFMDFDIHRIFEDARRRQNEGGRKVVSPPPRKAPAARATP